MGLDASILAGQIIFNAVFAVGYCGFIGCLGVLFVGVD
jgi:hypothetical protein